MDESVKLAPYMGDYTKPWTNARFCEYFGITGFISDTEAEPGSEWETILETMKKYA
jgi:glucuronate isomerase